MTAKERGFWDVLLTPRPGTDFVGAKCIRPELASFQYQILEVLTVETLQEVCPDLTFTVTRVSHDGGVDFIGIGKSVELQQLHVSIGLRVAGQIKRRQDLRPQDLISDLNQVGAGIRDDLEPREGTANGSLDPLAAPVSTLIFILSLRDDKRIATIREFFRNPYNSIYYRGPIIFVSANEFVNYWAAKRESVISLLTQCLDAADREIIDTYLQGIRPTSVGRIGLSAVPPPQGHTGRPIHCRLTFDVDVPLPQISVRLRHVQQRDGARVVEVLRPTKLAQESGVSMTLRPGTTSLELVLRSFVPGTMALGRIVVESKDGDELASADLGTVTLKKIFEPPYFEKPNRDIADKALEVLGATIGGGPAALYVTGAGGSGKSRFCEYIIDVAADSGFDWIAIRQENAPSNGRRMLRALMMELASFNAGGVVTTDSVIARVASILAPSERAIDALRPYFENDTEPTRAESVASSLLALLIDRSRHAPVIIHLQDLHWAGAEAFTILTLVMDYLQANRTSLPHGILTIFEGRDRETLAVDRRAVVPEDWLRFLASAGDNEIRVQPWNGKLSEEYLRLILAPGDPSAAVIEPERLVLHKELVEYVCNRARGNPMHLIEQLKRLHESDVVRYDVTGVSYIANQLPQGFDTPDTILDLIQARVNFYRDRDAAVVEFLTVLARIGRRVPASMFRHLTSTRDAPRVLDHIADMDVAVIPAPASGDDFEFVHENYYEVFSSQALRPDTPVLAHALAWYEGRPLVVREKVQHVRLLFARQTSELHLVGVIGDALDHARREHNDVALEELLRGMRGISEGIRQQHGIDSEAVAIEQARVLTHVGSWDASYALLKSAERTLRRRAGNAALLMWAEARAEMANVAVSLLKFDEAVQLCTEALERIRPSLDDAKLSRWYEYLLTRKAVALWFDGRAASAAPLEWEAYVRARARGDVKSISTTLRELGTLLLHRHPARGLRTMERSLELLQQLGTRRSAPSLVAVQLEMGRLLDASMRGDTGEVSRVRNRAHAQHRECLDAFPVYETVIAGLVAGAAAAIQHDLPAAHFLFHRTTGLAIQSQLFDEAWKARLNLAQIAAAQGKPAEAALNAREAASTMRLGLEKRDRQSALPRLQMLMLPLAHAVRLGGTTIDDLRPQIDLDAPWMEQWAQRPAAVTPSCAPQQVLHVRNGDDDYFLMN